MTETLSIAPLAVTPLHALHRARGGRMVTFAGYEMPAEYAAGAVAEHNHTRAQAGLFDISYLGQAFLVGPDHEATARALEALIPADIIGLDRGRQRYTQLLNEDGGILDDLIVTRSADPNEDGALMLVVNASRKEADYAHLSAHLPAGVRLLRADHRALVAIQGPLAAEVLARHVHDAAAMGFMTALSTRFDGIECHVSRSGYTGEDGFEISARASRITAIAERLLDAPQVKLIGLNARDSLRLEAGLCLYGQDLDETTSPIEAGLAWSIPQRRREEGGFAGAARVLGEIADGPRRLRVGVRPEGRQPAEQGADIVGPDGTISGKVTSCGIGPSVGGPIAVGTVERRFAAPGTAVLLAVGGKELPARVVQLPFVPHRYHGHKTMGD
jgi:aminomethyltransferase